MIGMGLIRSQYCSSTSGLGRGIPPKLPRAFRIRQSMGTWRLGSIQALDCIRYDAMENRPISFPYCDDFTYLTASYEITTPCGKDDAMNVLLDELHWPLHPCVFHLIGLICVDCDIPHETRYKAQTIMNFVAAHHPYSQANSHPPLWASFVIHAL